MSTNWVDFRINTPPDTPVLSLSPNPALSNQDVVSTLGPLTDSDGDPVSVQYVWLKDGTPTANTGSVLPHSATAKNQIWTMVATPYDGYDIGVSAEETVSIVNSPPQINSLTLSANTPTIMGSSIVTAVIAEFDPDGDPISHDYVWTVNGHGVGGNTPDLDGIVHFERDC